MTVDENILELVRRALKEDVGAGDVTTESTIPSEHVSRGTITAKADGVIAGLDVARAVFAERDPELSFTARVSDGDRVVVATVEGRTRAILTGERVALNFLQRLSGIATATAACVTALEGGRTRVLDTRKTTPGMRALEKYAVSAGGGENHRMGLWDMVLIKDNHIRAMAMQMKTSDSEKVIKEIIRRARESVQKNIRIEIEVETLKECECALEEKPDVIMLDNMSPEQVAEAVAIRSKKGLERHVLFEISGGITLSNVKDYALQGADIISTGSITAEVKPVNFSLEVILKK